jgi:hypothetical protein
VEEKPGFLLAVSRPIVENCQVQAPRDLCELGDAMILVCLPMDTDQQRWPSNGTTPVHMRRP